MKSQDQEDSFDFRILETALTNKDEVQILNIFTSHREPSTVGKLPEYLIELTASFLTQLFLKKPIERQHLAHWLRWLFSRYGQYFSLPNGEVPPYLGQLQWSMNHIQQAHKKLLKTSGRVDLLLSHINFLEEREPEPQKEQSSEEEAEEQEVNPDQTEEQNSQSNSEEDQSEEPLSKHNKKNSKQQRDNSSEEEQEEEQEEQEEQEEEEQEEQEEQEEEEQEVQSEEMVE